MQRKGRKNIAMGFTLRKTGSKIEYYNEVFLQFFHRASAEV
jgi:hypothetical protein